MCRTLSSPPMPICLKSQSGLMMEVLAESLHEEGLRYSSVITVKELLHVEELCYSSVITVKELLHEEGLRYSSVITVKELLHVEGLCYSSVITVKELLHVEGLHVVHVEVGGTAHTSGTPLCTLYGKCSIRNPKFSQVSGCFTSIR